MSERLLNPYKRGILLKLKSAYKGIWKELYPIFEMYQYLIQLEDYLILKLKDPGRELGEILLFCNMFKQCCQSPLRKKCALEHTNTILYWYIPMNNLLVVLTNIHLNQRSSGIHC